MSLTISTSAAAASIANTQAFNAYQDIAWSLQYSLCGTADAQAGFCAFLYDAPALSAGGIGKSLGYAPSQDYTSFANVSGVSGAIIGVGFDSTGLFAASGNGLSTGINASQVIRNAITIRTGTNFAYVTTFAATAFDSAFTVVQSSAALQQFRFRLTDASNTMEIAHWNGDSYDVWCNVPVALNLPVSAFCRAGFSFASPLCGNAAIAKFGIANAHFEGSIAAPTQQTNDVYFECKLPIINNVSQQAPASITIVPVVEPLAAPYAPIEPPPPAPDPCDAEPTATIKCGETISYSGNKGTQEYYIDAGTDVGEFAISYNSFTIPDRFSLYWNNSFVTTCFVGNSSYNNQLSALGYGPVVGAGAGVLKINKTTAYPTTVKLRVDAPLDGTAWDVQVLCIQVPRPSLKLYQGTSTSSSDLISYNGSINVGTFNVGQSAQQMFTIKNTGDADLSSMNLVQLLTASFTQYKINMPISVAAIAPNDSTTFGISFAPTITGENNARFALYSNDIFANPFVFNLSATVLANNVPLCACNSTINYSGSPGTFVYHINYGTDVGDILINYNAYSIPDRFTIAWNGLSATTGFVGVSSVANNSALTALGYPVVSSTTSSGILSVAKTSAYPTYATLTVDAPLAGTLWAVDLQCVYGGVDVVENYSLLDILLS